MSYYGVYIPVTNSGVPSLNSGANTINSCNLVDSASGVDEKIVTDVSEFVFQNKHEALQVLKQHKDARFKEFSNEEDALKFAQTGFEIVQQKYNDVKTSTEPLEKAAFRAPTKQHLVVLRKYIENEDVENVKRLIWENPRYLVSSGDTPTVLKEGYRYNAMHVCATYNRPLVAKLILDTVSDPKFTDLLLGKKNEEKTCKELCAKLLDYYLNLPEKGRNETPLHIAAKFGHLPVVKVLLSYPECNINIRNDRGQLARSIISQRGNNDKQHEICNVFDERYYVPVLRANDNVTPGQIGEPFSADNPPNLNCDPLTPELEIKALAGPMSEEQAKKFFRRWKTPPRLGSNVSSPIANNPFITPTKPHVSMTIRTHRGSNINFNSPTASVEKRSLFNSTPRGYDYNGVINSNGFDKSIHDDSIDGKENGIHEAGVNENEEEIKIKNHLGNLSKSQISMFKTSLCPHTPLFKLKNNAFSIYRDHKIDSPIVDSIEFVQQVNDSLLNVSDIYDSPGFKERNVKITDVEKGLECIGRVLAKEKNIEWQEYWDFLETFIDIASPWGLKSLEKYLAARQKEQDQRKKSDTTQKPDLLDDVCNALENAFRITATPTSATIGTNLTTHQSTTPYTYVEKSLQVHAKRMTKTIIHNIDNEISITDALLLELRRVKSLIYSFKEDEIYKNVNFEKVHSRIGNLVSIFLESSQEVSTQMKWKILVVLQNILKEQGDRREHMDCVCSRIVEMLQHPTEHILPENVKTEEMCSKIWSEEKDCDCQWESNLSRKTSRRNRMEARYKNYQRLKQQQKLQKELDNQPKDNNEEKNCNAENESLEEDEFWSDFGGSDSEEDEVFLTPCESPSLLSQLDNADEDNDKIFIYGNEPTKRDLDVLNAIFHADINKSKYPNIHSWKTRVMRYSNEEMDFFPSPRSVKKSHSFMATSSNKKDLTVQPRTSGSLQKSYSIACSNTSSLILNSTRQQSPLASSNVIKEPVLQLPSAKQLFMSPVRTKSMTAISLSNNTNSNNILNATTTTTITDSTIEDVGNVAKIKFPVQQQFQTKRPLTPLNKLRGLFSAYRETVESSPLPTSPSSDSYDWLQ